MKKVLYALVLLFSITTKNLFPLSNRQMDTIGKFVRTSPKTWDMQSINTYLTQIENALPKAGPQAGGRLRTYKKKLERGIATLEALPQRAEIVVKTVLPKPRTTRDVATQTEPWTESRTTRDVATQTEPWLEQKMPAASRAQTEITPPQPQITLAKPEVIPTQATPTQPEVTPVQPHIIPTQITPTQPTTPATPVQDKKQPAPAQPLPSLATSVEAEAHAAGIEFFIEK
jgi:hypothetical protein